MGSLWKTDNSPPSPIQQVITAPLWQEVVTFLPQDPSNEGNGSLRRRQRGGSGLTAPIRMDGDRLQSYPEEILRGDEAIVELGIPQGSNYGGYPVIPGSWGCSEREHWKFPLQIRGENMLRDDY